MDPSEQQRSKARRLAGRRLEKAHLPDVRQLRLAYNASEKSKSEPTKKYLARRTEWIRADLGYMYQDEYTRYFTQELEKLTCDM